MERQRLVEQNRAEARLQKARKASDAAQALLGEAEAAMAGVQAQLDQARRQKAYLWKSKQMEVEGALKEWQDRLRQARASLPSPQALLLDEAVQRLAALRRTAADHNLEHERNEIDSHPGVFLREIGKPDQLTPMQQRAIVRDDKFNLVVAAAGSGKTSVLTHRIAYLVERGVPSEGILAITFTKLAASEMKKRLETRFGITDVEVRTFNAFGLSILKETRSVLPEVAKEHDLQNCIRNAIHKHTRQDGPFMADLLTYLSTPDPSLIPAPEDFATQQAFYEQAREQQYETLRGEKVRSLGEKQIADFLTLHGVRYQYEGVAEWVAKSVDRGNYRPDFTLPDHKVCIENWAIREGQRVPEWFEWSTEEYLEKMQWARRQFSSRGLVLVETYSDERQAGTLAEALAKRLQEAGVVLRKVPYERLVQDVHGFQHLEREAIKLFEKWIQNAKALGLKPADIPDRLRACSPRTQAFGRCALTILEEYEDFLRRRHIVDFADMIYEAVGHMKANPQDFLHRYQHILVDEFQDVSQDKVELLRALVLDGPAHLFCVGDDWQSIFAFAGSDVSFFKDFESWFGVGTTTMLAESHRCPVGVLEAGNRLMQHNKGQIPKEVEPQSGNLAGPVVEELQGGLDFYKQVADHAIAWIGERLALGADPVDLMVLSRYKLTLENLGVQLKALGIPYSYDESAGVALLTVHKAKGKERKHVLLLAATEGRHGFPSQVEDPRVLDPVRLAPSDRIEEERRLFYVALTRAKESWHVQTTARRKSRFIIELQGR